MKQIFIFTILLIHTHTALAKMEDSIKSHLDTAIQILKTNSLYAKKVNWAALQEKMYEMADTATTKAATFPVIAYAFQQLGDHHGMFAQYDEQYRNPDSAAIKRYPQNLLNEWKKGWKIKTDMIGTTAYLRMPNVTAFNQKQIEFYTNLLRDSLAKLAALQPAAWVLDMRMNTGGNMIPMLATLAPFFENGIVSWYINQQQHATEPNAFENGNLLVDGKKTVEIKQDIPAIHKAKIAVLTGAGTSSSGEICAAILRQRKNTKLFGEATFGLCNVTQGFVFNNEQSYFLLTTQHVADKFKKPFPYTVQPDDTVQNNDLFNDLLNDYAMQAALQWIRKNK